MWACCTDAANRKLLSGDTESGESKDTTRKDTNRKTVIPRLTYEKKGGEDYCKPSSFQTPLKQSVIRPS